MLWSADLQILAAKPVSRGEPLLGWRASLCDQEAMAAVTKSASAKLAKPAVAGRGAAAGGLLDGGYRLLMRRNSVYVAFILAGAMVGERVVDYSINKLWERNNRGKLYDDIPDLGSKVEAAE